MNAFSCALFAQPFSVLGATKFPYRVRMFVFQLSELHIYVIPTDLWQVERRLVDTSIIEQCVSVGFVRLEFLLLRIWNTDSLVALLPSADFTYHKICLLH